MCECHLHIFVQDIDLRIVDNRFCWNVNNVGNH